MKTPVTNKTVTIGKRDYAIESYKEMEDGWVYRLTWREKIFWTVRNRPNPALMFLVNDEGPLGQGAPKCWLTDRDDVLAVVPGMRTR